jgi:hypothetical protein
MFGSLEARVEGGNDSRYLRVFEFHEYVVVRSKVNLRTWAIQISKLFVRTKK